MVSFIHPFNTFRPRQNGCHIADAIYKCIFLNENVWISIRISLKFVSKGPINNKSALVQVMYWHWIDINPLLRPLITWTTDTSIILWSFKIIFINICRWFLSITWEYCMFKFLWFFIFIKLQPSAAPPYWWSNAKVTAVYTLFLGDTEMYLWSVSSLISQKLPVTRFFFYKNVIIFFQEK